MLAALAANVAPAALLAHFASHQQEPTPPTPAPAASTPALPASVDAGLRFLVATQRDDGGWSAPALGAHDRFADTALAALALVAAGERVDGGRHHPALRRAVRHLQERVPAQGPISVDRPRPGGWQRFECWYAAFATLVFAEVHAQSPSADFAATLQRLHARLAFLQKQDGGWCHDLEARVRNIQGLGRAEYSEDLAAVGAFCVGALTASARVGVPPPHDVLPRATRWLLQLANDDGGIAYGLGHTWPDAVLSEPGRTAGTLWALLPELGRSHPRLRAAARYLDREFAQLPNSAGHGGKEFLVSHATSAFACRSWSDGAAARHRDVYAAELLRRQHDDGHFVMGNGAWDTPANNTAVAVITLLAADATLVCVPRSPLAAPNARATAALRAQRATDGSWRGKWGSRQMDLALTALAVRALLAADPLGGPRDAAPSIAWLVREVHALSAADFVDDRRSHLGFQLPYVLHALADRPDCRDCRAAAALVVGELQRSQRADGGLGYDRDELYTLCVATSNGVLALAAARAAGIAVDATAVTRALDYLQACQGETGGFRYCRDPSHPILAKDRVRYLREELARTTGAVVALARGGRGESDACRRAIAWLASEITADALREDDRYLWFTLLGADGIDALLPEPTAANWRKLVAARLRGLQDEGGAFRWPGMDWSEALGRPGMHRPFATAAGALLLASHAREE